MNKPILLVILSLTLTALACNTPAPTPPIAGPTADVIPLPSDTPAPLPVSATPSHASLFPALTVEALRNATYEMVPGGLVAPLVDGTFSFYNETLRDDTVVTFREPTTFADLNGDGADDALVVLVLHTNRTTGHFYSMFAMLNQNGVPVQAGSTSLGDNVIINGITVLDGVIAADLVVSGPNDGACCPNTPLIRNYRFEEAALVEYVNGATITPYILPLNYDMLLNLTYHDVFLPGESFTLANGTFSKPTEIGALVVSLTEHFTIGDLDGDGVRDAVGVLLAQTEGTTGVFFHLVAIHNNGGAPEHVATVSLGDRVVINAMWIDAGVITLDMLIVGPNDGLCCPNTPAILAFRLEGNTLVPVD